MTKRNLQRNKSDLLHFTFTRNSLAALIFFEAAFVEFFAGFAYFNQSV
jgi:hypothetical protein